jgi:hypothetical protein
MGLQTDDFEQPLSEYLAHLHVLENQAKAAKHGGWGMVQP